MKLVVKEFWESTRRNNMFLFNTRNFYPKGQSVRTLVKELFTLGLYDAEKAKKTKVLDGQYTDEIGEEICQNYSVKFKRFRGLGGTNLINVTYVSEER